MKRPLFLLAGLVAVCAPLAAPAAAQANVFCPVTVAAVADVSAPNRPNTIGILLDVDRGDTRSARVRLDTDAARYAVDVDDLPLMTFAGTRPARYVSLPPGEHLVAAWVQATGLAPNQRLDCPMTALWTATPTAASPTSPTSDRDRRMLLDAAPRTALSTPMRFPTTTPIVCASPSTAARAVAPIRPAFPPEAHSVNATGVVELQLDVDDTGTVAGGRVSRSSGFAALDRAALDTAKRAKFAPATYRCQPVATAVTVTTGFGV